MYRLALFLFILASLSIPVIVAVYLEKIEYEPYKINEDNAYSRTISLMNEQVVEDSFSFLEDRKFTGTRNSSPTVCILDVFDVEEGSTYSHGERVMHMVGKRYQGPVTILPVEHFTFLKTPMEEWNKCDVINYSMGVESDNINTLIEKEFVRFLEQYDGIFIASAGNSGKTENSSQWAYIREKHPTLNTDNLFIVTQGQISDIGEQDAVSAAIKTSYGASIDLVVFNYGEYLYGQKQHGSSFASPVVTSVVANLLASGMPKEEVITKLNTLPNIEIGSYQYKQFAISNMYN